MTSHLRLTVFSAVAVVLGSLSLFPVIQGGRWFWLAMIGVILVGATGEVCHRLRAPRPLVPLAQAAVLVMYLTARLAGEQAILGLIPGGAALTEVRATFRSGFEDIGKYAAPVPAGRGVSALAVVGVCTIGLLVYVLAVTLRRAALAGLPLLALYSVPASVVRDGVPWLVFLLAGCGYLTLLFAEGRDRIAQWGRPLRSATRDGRGTDGPGGGTEFEASPLGQAGRRIGVAALGLAVVVPALLPGLAEGILTGDGFGNGSGSGSGSRTLITADPMVSLKQSVIAPTNEVILKVETNNPNASEQYLKDATLDVFNGEQWKTSTLHLTDVPKRFPLPEGLSDEVVRSEYRTKISVKASYSSPWLLMPQPPVSEDAKGHWRFDPVGGAVVGDRGQTIAHRTYTVTSLALSPSESLLDSASPSPIGMSSYLQLPPMPRLVRQLAVAATTGAKTPYQKALKLQEWFTSNFTYSTNVTSGNSTNLLVDFLRPEKRKGYCEQFAASMAVMARLLGIPSRVAVGFTAGQQQADGSYLVTTHDRHAWPELYFDNVGWLRFEPTPSIAGANGHGSVPPWASAAANARTGLDTTAPDAVTNPSAKHQRCLGQQEGRIDCDPSQDPAAAPGATDGRDRTGTRFPVLPAAAIVLALLAGVTPALIRVAVRRHRFTRGTDLEQRIHGAWAELRDTMLDFGLTWSPAHTPRQSAERMIREGGLTGAPAEGVIRIARAVERLHYARAHGPVGDLFADVKAAGAALAAHADRRHRLRARVAPPSTLAMLRTTGSRISELRLRLAERLRAGVRARLHQPRGGET